MDLDLSPPAWIFVARRTFFLFFSLPSIGTSNSRILSGNQRGYNIKTNQTFNKLNFLSSESSCVHLIGLGSVLLGAQADLTLWADDGNKDILEAVLIAHADDQNSVLTQHSKQWPNAVERHAWNRQRNWNSNWLSPQNKYDYINYLTVQFVNIGTGAKQQWRLLLIDREGDFRLSAA